MTRHCMAAAIIGTVAAQAEEAGMVEHAYVSQARSASGLNILLGFWLIASPWIFGYQAMTDAFANGIATGLLVAIMAFWRLFAPRGGIGQSWLAFVLGLWTIASPWIWGFWGNVPALWDNMAAGIAIAVVAGWSGSASTAYERRHSPPTAIG